MVSLLAQPGQSSDGSWLDITNASSSDWLAGVFETKANVGLLAQVVGNQYSHVGSLWYF